MGSGVCSGGGDFSLVGWKLEREIMKDIKGWARIYKENGMKYSFETSIFVYPTYQGAMEREVERGSELVGVFPIHIRIEGDRLLFEEWKEAAKEASRDFTVDLADPGNLLFSPDYVVTSEGYAKKPDQVEEGLRGHGGYFGYGAFGKASIETKSD